MTRYLPMTLIFLTLPALAHDAPFDWSWERMPPLAANHAATGAASFDASTGSYLLTARRDGGETIYRVSPGRPDGSNGLFAVHCSVDGAPEFLATGGVTVRARDNSRRESMPDGTIRVLAMGNAGLEGGYTEEPAGHGPCIRLGDTLPVAPHLEGAATYRLDVPPGEYEVGVRYMDDRDDSSDDAYIRLKIGAKTLGQWNLADDDDRWRERLLPAEIGDGDALRIEARADDSNGSGGDFCRISHILIRPIGHTAPEISHELRGGSVWIRQPAREALGIPGLSAEIRLAGMALSCHVAQAGEAAGPAGFSGIDLLPGSVGQAGKLVQMPYLAEPVAMTGGGEFLSTFTCRFTSHCTRMRYLPSFDEGTGAVYLFGPHDYLSNSADRFFELDETLYITASREVLNVLPSFPARKSTPGRRAISNRVVFDHWRMARGPGLQDQLRIMRDCGMEDLLVILHTWMHYGYDRKQPQFTPANPLKWTDEEFQGAIAACREIGYRVAVHENYNHMDWDSPYNSPTPAREFGEPDRPGDPGSGEAIRLITADPGEDLSRQPRNAWAFARLADMRVGPGPLSRPLPPAFPISSDKMLFYSQIESHRIERDYGTTAGYLDVSPCVQPGLGTWDLHIDLDARNQNARGFGEAYRNSSQQFAHHGSIFEITTGEGGSYATYSAGYINAVERQAQTRMQTPIIPHHELTVVRPLSLHHGMGYYSRYFPEDTPSTEWDFDLYRAMELAFGHAGFIGDTLLPQNTPGPEAIREYYLVRAVQEAFADAELASIRYWHDGAWLALEEALRRGADLVQSRIWIAYGNGLDLALNFHRGANWTLRQSDFSWLDELGPELVLPPGGWVAACPGRGLLAMSAITGGERIDLCRCPEYTYRHDREAATDSPFAHHVIHRQSGLQGASSEDCPGILAALSASDGDVVFDVPPEFAAAPRLNLTVVNSADATRRRIRVRGFDAQPACSMVSRRVGASGRLADRLVWENPPAGKWRVAMGYSYTDPDHPEEATRVELVDPMDGAPVVVSPSAPGNARATVGRMRRNARFVEALAEVGYPARATAGQPIEFTMQKLKFGVSGAPDNDYAEELALVLTSEETGETLKLVVPELPRRTIREIEGFGGDFEADIPAHSVLTFEARRR